MREIRVRSGEVELAVTDDGVADGPVIVLLHGYPDTSAVWRPVATQLADRYRVVRYDVRGAGASSAPAGTGGYTLDALVGDLAAVLEAVVPGEPVHLVGHDWGSVQGWAALTDARTKASIASFTSISGPDLGQFAAWLHGRARQGPRGAAQVARQLAHSYYIGFFRLPLLPELVWRAGLARGWPRLLEMLEGVQRGRQGPEHPAGTLADDAVAGLGLYRANFSTHHCPQVVDTPVQLIVPTRDRYITPAAADAALRWTPRLWRRAVPERHWVPLNRPVALARWIDEFVSHLGGGRPTRTLRRARGGPRPAKVFADTLVTISGAGGGIGRATALAFAANGAELVVSDIDREAAEGTAKLINDRGGTAHAYRLDVADAAAFEAHAAQVCAAHGLPDVVVNNAGIALAGSFFDHSDADWRAILDVNLLGVVNGCRAFGRRLADRGEGGHLVNIASAAAFAPTGLLPAYSATKAAVRMLSDCLRGELAADGVAVCAICPGFTDTGIARAARYVGLEGAEQQRMREAAARGITLRSFPPEKVALAVLRAVRDDRPIVPVNAEARIGYLLSRLAPSALRRLARQTADAGPLRRLSG